MLWTAVWAMYLGMLRFVRMPLPFGVALTIYLAVLLAIRIKWGYKRGLRIAILGSVLVLACFVTTSFVVHLAMGQSTSRIADLSMMLWLSFCNGVFFGAFGFVFVHILVIAVDWIDSLMRTKTPPDQ